MSEELTSPTGRISDGQPEMQRLPVTLGDLPAYRALREFMDWTFGACDRSAATRQKIAESFVILGDESQRDEILAILDIESTGFVQADYSAIEARVLDHALTLDILGPMAPAYRKMVVLDEPHYDMSIICMEPDPKTLRTVERLRGRKKPDWSQRDKRGSKRPR